MQKRYAVIDWIRFVLAFFVVLRHFGVPAFLQAQHRSIAALIMGNLFDGPAAVLVFFVISGFCIHLAYTGREKFGLWSYFLRREIRIGLPTAAICLLALAIRAAGILDVLWSLWCEEIYYLAYPAILKVKARFGWLPIWLVAIALFVVCRLTSRDDAGAFISPGWAKTWMLGLPCWLFGCWMAEFVVGGGLARVPKLNLASLWVVRLGIWLLASLASIARFHMHISNMDSLPAFGFISGFWLLVEMRYYQDRELSVPKMILASFSLYLCHPVVPTLVELVWKHPPYIVALIATLAFTYGFFVFVEAPCHELARRLGKAKPTPLA